MKVHLKAVRTKAFIGRMTVVAVVLLCWQIASDQRWINPLFVSTPLDVGRTMIEFAGDAEARSALRQTGTELLFAFLIGTSSGLAVGAAIGLSRVLRKAYLSPILFILSIPKSMFVPIFVLLMGIGQVSATAFGAFSAFFYVVVNLVGGIDLVEEKHRTVATAFGASRRATFVNLIVPASLPGLFAALWQGVNHAFSGVLIAELWASRNGIGELIAGYTAQLQTDKIIALTLILAIVSILVGNLWTILERRLDWRATETKAIAEIR